jgi:amino acid transporter
VRLARGPLRRQVSALGTVSMSIGVMAPTLAMSITGVEPARLLGRAAPLAYVFAGLGVGLVAYGFMRLAGAFAHAGSVYAFVGQTLGARPGFVTAWAMLGTYLVFPAVSISAIAVFSQAIFPDAPWWPFAVGGWAVILLLASRQIRTATRSLLALEGISLLLIVALMVVIAVKLLTGDAPAGQGFSSEVFDVPPGVGLSTIGLAATFGLLSFAGFESAGSLGEESERPTRAIPRSIAYAVVFGAVFYVACMAIQTLGFGTDAAGVRAFAGSDAPLADLGEAYVGPLMADVLSIGAIISAIGAGLGCASCAARMLYALGRERLLPGSLARVSTGTGAPAAGLAFVMTLDLAGLMAFAAAGTPAIRAFFYLATIGVLSLLVMYVLTNVGAVRFLLARGGRWEVALPVAGIAVACYVLYRNVWPVPDPPFDVFPYVVAAWLAIGIGLAARVTPGGVGRLGGHDTISTPGPALRRAGGPRRRLRLR